MRPTPIEESDVPTGAVRLVVGPPPSMEDEVGPVEVVAGRGDDGVGYYAVRMVLEEPDVVQAALGARVFWLTFLGDHMHPFSVNMPIPEDHTCGAWIPPPPVAEFILETAQAIEKEHGVFWTGGLRLLANQLRKPSTSWCPCRLTWPACTCGSGRREGDRTKHLRACPWFALLEKYDDG